MLIHWRTICSIMHFTTRAERFVLCRPLTSKSCLVYYGVLTFYICDPDFLAFHWTKVQRMNIVKRVPAYHDIYVYLKAGTNSLHCSKRTRESEMAISLIEAIRSGDVTLAKKLLAQRKFTCLNSQTARNDGTALYWACCLGYLELARSLLEQGANPNTLTAWRGSPLHAACDNDQFDVAQ